jgi:CheY-like chemotaxis protein
VRSPQEATNVQRPTTIPKSVLVIDDHEDICEFVVAALEQGGFDVRSAPEGAKALALQRVKPADLLITDLFMPGQEGFETIAVFRTEFPQTRIIAMSAGGARNMQADYLDAASLAGVDATLRKPFSAAQLVDTVQMVLAIP